MPHGKAIDPLDLDALRLLKKTTEIGDDTISPMVDAAYVLNALQEMTDKLNEVIQHNNQNNYEEKIQIVAAKLNQVVAVMNANTNKLARDLEHELAELRRDLPD